MTNILRPLSWGVAESGWGTAYRWNRCLKIYTKLKEVELLNYLRFLFYTFTIKPGAGSMRRPNMNSSTTFDLNRGKNCHLVTLTLLCGIIFLRVCDSVLQFLDTWIIGCLVELWIMRMSLHNFEREGGWSPKENGAIIYVYRSLKLGELHRTLWAFWNFGNIPTILSWKIFSWGSIELVKKSLDEIRLYRCHHVHIVLIT